MAKQNYNKLELTWIGKGEEPKLEPRILIENPELSYGDPKSENMIIHGDNLLALLDSLDSTFISSFINQICLANKITSQDKLDEIREHLLLNIKIIRLATNVFPEEIRDTLVQFFADYAVVPFKSKEFTNLKNNQYTL